MSDKLTLAQFLERAPAALEAFAAATRERQEANDSAFVGKHLTREEVDWWREVAAYTTWVEVGDLLCIQCGKPVTAHYRRGRRLDCRDVR